MFGCCLKIFNFIQTCFMDLRLISILMCCWLAVVNFIMVEMGVYNNPVFVAFGPRAGLSFMHVAIDTQYKYTILVIMIILHTFISDFIADSMSQHIINTLQDMRGRYLPHRPIVYYIITTLWSVYCAISHLFLIFLALGQLDLLLVRLLSDIIANMVTTTLYLQNKTYNPEKFHSHEKKEENNHNNEFMLVRSGNNSSSSAATAIIAGDSAMLIDKNNLMQDVSSTYDDTDDDERRI